MEYARHTRTRHLEEAQAKIKALLGTEDLALLALEKWKDQLQAAGEQYEREQYQPLEDLKFIQRVTDTLFELSPMLRASRRASLLALEADEASLQKRFTPTELVEQSLATAKKIEAQLQAKEDRARGRRLKIKYYSPSFRKERERLEEWRSAHLRDSFGGLREANASLVHLQSRLFQGLSEIPIL